jgi:hypothetical protein
MKTKKYIQAVHWIAGNDEPTIMNWVDMRDLVSVSLVADLFAVNADEVSKDVIMVRLYGNIKGKK